MDPAPLLLLLFAALPLLPLRPAVYTGPLQAEISNGTFHHFFVPDGDYEETEDPEKCQMLFRFADARPCGAQQDEDALVREELMLTKQQVEDTARLLESIVTTISHDLDGEESYGGFLRREISQIGEAFGGVEESLLELEVKFKQSQDTELREEHQLHGSVAKPLGEVRDAVRQTGDKHLGLRDKQELLSLIIRSHGTRLSRLKTEYLTV